MENQGNLYVAFSEQPGSPIFLSLDQDKARFAGWGHLILFPELMFSCNMRTVFGGMVDPSQQPAAHEQHPAGGLSSLGDQGSHAQRDFQDSERLVKGRCIPFSRGIRLACVPCPNK